MVRRPVVAGSTPRTSTVTRMSAFGLETDIVVWSADIRFLGAEETNAMLNRNVALWP
jgi:hypothetical protein